MADKAKQQKKKERWQRSWDSILQCFKKRMLLVCWHLQLVFCTVMEMVKSDRNPYVESSDPYVKFSEACQMCSVQNTLGMGMDLLEC